MRRHAGNLAFFLFDISFHAHFPTFPNAIVGIKMQGTTRVFPRRTLVGLVSECLPKTAPAVEGGKLPILEVGDCKDMSTTQKVSYTGIEWRWVSRKPQSQTTANQGMLAKAEIHLNLNFQLGTVASCSCNRMLQPLGGCCLKSHPIGEVWESEIPEWIPVPFYPQGCDALHRRVAGGGCQICHGGREVGFVNLVVYPPRSCFYIADYGGLVCEVVKKTQQKGRCLRIRFWQALTNPGFTNWNPTLHGVRGSSWS